MAVSCTSTVVTASSSSRARCKPLSSLRRASRGIRFALPTAHQSCERGTNCCSRSRVSSRHSRRGGRKPTCAGGVVKEEVREGRDPSVKSPHSKAMPVVLRPKTGWQPSLASYNPRDPVLPLSSCQLEPSAQPRALQARRAAPGRHSLRRRCPPKRVTFIEPEFGGPPRSLRLV